MTSLKTAVLALCLSTAAFAQNETPQQPPAQPPVTQVQSPPQQQSPSTEMLSAADGGTGLGFAQQVNGTTPAAAAPAAADGKPAGSSQWNEARPLADKSKPPFKLSAPKVGGYVIPLFQWGTSDRVNWGNFSLKRARLKFSGEIVEPQFGYTVLLGAENPTKLIRDAYASWFPLKDIEFRAGQFKNPFGYENWASITVLPTIDRSLVSDNLVKGADTRDLGIAGVGTVHISDDLGIEYRVAILNGSGGNTPDATSKKDPMGRVGVTWGKLLKVGVSGGSREQLNSASAREQTTLIGADAMLDLGPVFAYGEYVRGMVSGPKDALRSGFYVVVVGRVCPWLRPLARYEQYTANQGVADAMRKRATFGLDFPIYGDNFRLTTNYRYDFGALKSDALELQAQVLW